MQYIEKLMADCDKAKRYFNGENETVGRERVIQGNSLDECIVNLKDLEPVLKTFKRAVYIIEQIDGDHDQLRAALNKARKENKHRRYPRDNEICFAGKIQSSVIYVGSSQKNLIGRLNYHMGDKAGATSALNLRDWFNGKLKITIKEFDAEPGVLQIIEDAIWHDKSPAFGKPGSNNKLTKI